MSRICASDGKPLPKASDPRMAVEGWYCCGEYFCSQECLDKSFHGTGETWEEHYESVGGDNGGDCYWTDWEDDDEDEE